MTQPETMKGKAAGKKFFGEMTKAFPDAQGDRRERRGASVTS